MMIRKTKTWLRILALERQYQSGEVTKEVVEERLKEMAGDHWHEWLQRITGQH